MQASCYCEAKGLAEISKLSVTGRKLDLDSAA